MIWTSDFNICFAKESHTCWISKIEKKILRKLILGLNLSRFQCVCVPSLAWAAGREGSLISGSPLHISGGPYSTHYKSQGKYRRKEDTSNCWSQTHLFLSKLIHRVTTSRLWVWTLGSLSSLLLQSLFVQQKLLKYVQHTQSRVEPVQ